MWVTGGLEGALQALRMIRDQEETVLTEDRAVQGMPQENLAGGDEETVQREYTWPGIHIYPRDSNLQKVFSGG